MTLSPLGKDSHHQMHAATPVIVFGDFYATAMLFAPVFLNYKIPTASNCNCHIEYCNTFSLAWLIYTHSIDMLLITQLYDIILSISILKAN